MVMLGPYLLGPNDTPENGIYVGDCKELAKKIPDKSIDLFVIDPPYFLPIQSYVGTREKGYVKRTLADTSILASYFSMIFDEVGRTLKIAGTAYVFCDGQSYPIMYRAMFPHFKYVRPLIWDKVVSYNGYTWRHQHEIVAWGERHDALRIPTGDGDVIQCRGVRQKDRRHPAEKPVELITKLIDKHQEAQIIVDFYGGSVPVAVAASRLNRHWLIFELDKDIATRARKRVQEAQPPLFMPEPEQTTLPKTFVAGNNG